MSKLYEGLPVMQMDDDLNEINRYENERVAALKMGVDPKQLRLAIKWERKCYGYRWSYIGGDFEKTSNCV